VLSVVLLSNLACSSVVVLYNLHISNTENSYNSHECARRVYVSNF